MYAYRTASTPSPPSLYHCYPGSHPLFDSPSLPSVFVSCPPPIQFALRPDPSTPDRLPLPFLARSNVRLVVLYGARTRPEEQKHAPVLCFLSARRPWSWCLDRQHEESRTPCCPGSLPGIPEDCYRRVLREAFTPGSHAMHNVCDARYTTTTLRRFSSFFCPYPGTKKQCVVARNAGLHIWAHVCINPPQIRCSQGCRPSTRARVCRNLALARPISSQTSVAHPTTTRNVCRSPLFDTPCQLFPIMLFVMVAIAVMYSRSVTNTSNPPCKTNETYAHARSHRPCGYITGSGRLLFPVSKFFLSRQNKTSDPSS
jgi:hypothetical protein